MDWHPFTGTGVVEFGLTAIKNEFMQCLFLSIGAEYTSIFKCVYKWLRLAKSRGHATRPAVHTHLSWRVLQSTFCTVQLKCAGSPSSRSSCQTHISQQLLNTIYKEIAEGIKCKTIRQNMWTSDKLTHNTRPHNDHEVLLTLAWIILCSLTLFVKSVMPLLPKFASSMNITGEKDNGVTVAWTNHQQ